MYRNNQRSAFTLIEILVVIAIIGILAALTLQATSTYVDLQRHANTEDFVRTVSKTLEQQIKNVMVAAETEAIPQRIINMGRLTTAPGTFKNDPPSPRELQRARVIYKILRLKKEFPMSYLEALHPAFSPFAAPLPATAFLDPMPVGTPFPINDPPAGANKVPTIAQYTANTKGIQNFVLQTRYVGPGKISSSDLRPKGAYETTLGTSPVGNQPDEGAVCLLMILQERSHGATLMTDSIASAHIVTVGTSLKGLVDSWGTPLTFLRYPRGGPNSPLTGNSPAAPGAKGAVLTDPLDPEGLLSDPEWNNVTNFDNWQGVYWFEWYAYQVHVWPNTGNPKSYAAIKPVYTLPVVASAGKNGQTTVLPSPPPWTVTAKLGMGLITGATNANPIVITSVNHRLTTGQQVLITGVTGNTNANGRKTITVTGPDTFTIPGPPSATAYAGGGTWNLPAENDNIYSWKLRMGANIGN